ncbi:hypothetical protein HB776_17925 [Tardiphaga robiniae]|uniref:AMP-binding enzyme C-terminal domain-containing protein n=1 Tax=Tardiphaga robiniae TaxID=943830 RepID=A0A7G6U929_9BRAD|nr:hypothetical protein HB776_17925 [Tardiphaga robiniae]
MGEAVKAIIVARPGTNPTFESISAFCSGRLGGYKLPKTIDFVASVPRNSLGKIMKAELRKPFWKGKSRQV